MSIANSPENKKKRRLEKALRKATQSHNRTRYRQIDGQFYPYTLAPIDYLKRYNEAPEDARQAIVDEAIKELSEPEEVLVNITEPTK